MTEENSKKEEKMSDVATAPAPVPPQNYEFELAKMRIENSAAYVGKMIWLITFIAGGISVIVVVSVVVIAIVEVWAGSPEIKIPDVLSNWGGIILGFYFGQFVNLVKDFMGIVSGTSLPAQIGGTPAANPSATTRVA
jgi:hypothetical protein